MESIQSVEDYLSRYTKYYEEMYGKDPHQTFKNIHLITDFW